MRPGKWSSVAALLAALMWNMPQLALAHGGGGGHGGGGFGGGGFGGGHGGFGGGHMGGFGGGHMGGFGGGHMGGFGGGHMGGFGGHYGGFSGGHYGGLGGGHYGGLGGGHYGGGLGGHSGLGGYSLGGGHSGHSGLGSSIGGLHSGGIGHSGTLGGVSGLGSHHAGSALGTVHHNPNSFTTQHVAGQHLSNSALGNHVTSGYRGVGNTFAGTHAQGLLSHQANNVGGHSNFLQHHHVGGTGTAAGHGVAGLTGSSGMTGMHHGGMHHGGMGQGGMYGHHHGMYGNHGFNRGFYPFFGFPFFGFPFFGYGGYYGYGGYGYGYGYNPYAYYYGPYGYGYNYPSAYAYPGVQNQPNQPAQPAVKASDSQVFAQKGENDFKAGDYKAAVYAWRHALVDDPQNGVLMMMLAQGLFASGNFNEAAGAVQQAMMLLPEDQWGVVVSNYRELYGKVGDYTTQLRALEKAVKDAPDEAGTRFLLGYHYGFLGYPQQAVKQLDKTLQLQPDDQLAKKLRDQFQAKLPNQGGNNAAPANGNKGQVNGQADDKTAGEAKAADAKGA